MFKKLQNNNFSRQKGVSLYLALMIVNLLLAMVLGLSAIFIGQLGMIKGMGDSVIALSAADSGIERVLYDGSLPQNYYSGSLNGASFEVRVSQPLGGKILGVPEDPDCQAFYFCIKSIGKFRGVKRAIEVIR